MKVLVIGAGAREHAITWKVAQSSLVENVYVAPGNAGTHRELKTENVDINPLDFENLINFAKSKNVGLTIVGPEMPLVSGIQDAFTRASLLCLGPNQQAAQLEASKTFCKDFLNKYNIPTAKARSFGNIEEAKNYLEQQALPVVIKADGLCGGKGVVIAKTYAEAYSTLEAILQDHQLGDAGNRVVIEEFLEGEEASFIILTDGKYCFPFATSQDHKARDDGDMGPNTGGMGAYSPTPVIDDSLHNQIMQTIVSPTLAGFQNEGITYQGFLYIGLMITHEGPKVLEFNCRLGDPEAQTLLMRLDNDFVQLCLATLSGNLHSIEPVWKTDVALGVVLAAAGYPANVKTNEIVQGLNDIPTHPQYKIFHGATKIENGRILTNGGRVFCVTALGADVEIAKKRAYDLIAKIKWDGSFYRNDIGHRALK